MEVHGQCDERFLPVREAFERNFEENGDVGACFAATLEGEYVVDLWAGYQDEARTRPWLEDTIVNVYSTTKTMTFLCALMLADRGELDLDAPVVNYWPEFGANGKDRIPVRFLLSHTAGVPGFSRPFSNAELYNWEFACADLASQEPWWEPGIQSGYHAITQGYLIGEVIRRITGRTIGTYFREEVAEKIEVDFHIGVPPSEFNRIADLIPALEIAPILQMDPDSITARVFAGEMTEGDLTDVTRTDGWRRAEIPAANGHGNARSVVRAQTALANNGRAFGVELLSPDGARKALEPQIDGVDVVLGLPIQFAMGFALPTEGIPISPNANTLWWGGAGGSLIAIDTDAHLCFSYVMNQMDNHIVGDPRGTGLGSALYGCIDV